MPALLIAANFLREQRWFVLFLLLYVAMLSLVYVLNPPTDLRDLLVLLKQLAGFAVLFSLSIVSGALQQERRSRRILAVLSKGITRREYMAGFLLGGITISAIYAAGMLVSAWGLQHRMEFPLQPLLSLIAITLVACVATNTIALLFATFLHPLFAMAATALAVAVPFALAHSFAAGAMNTLPVAALLDSIASFSFARSWSVPWGAIWLALLQGVVFWMAAAWIFSKRDIAVATE
jgi:hypothetical protein